MKKYLIVYRTSYNTICNIIVTWDGITEENINNFEVHNPYENEYVCILNIIKLD